MMKKLMILFIVLGLVNIASAGVVDITINSLNGVSLAAPVKEITILPTDKIDFRITFTAPNTEYLFAIGSQINVSGPGSLDWSQFVYATYDPDEDLWTNVDIHSRFDPALHLRGNNWIVEASTVTQGPRGTGLEIWVVKNILLHCDAFGTVKIWLTNYAGSDGTIVVDSVYNQVPWQYGAGVTIHQLIPEPMTLTLLGLGSLFLARRKK
jgi:hypothetical protein